MLRERLPFILFFCIYNMPFLVHYSGINTSILSRRSGRMISLGSIKLLFYERIVLSYKASGLIQHLLNQKCLNLPRNT